jgi:hypothetical protein
MGTPPPVPGRRAAAKSSGGTLKVILIVGVTVVSFLAVMGTAAFFTWKFIQKKKAEVVAERKAEKDVIHEMATDIEKLMGEMRDENGQPKETDFRLKTGNAAANDAERAREVLNGFLNDLASLQNQYLQDLNQAGLQGLMDPTRLRSDTTFEETRRILKDSRQVAEGVRQKGLDLMDTFPERLEGKGFSEKIKREILQGYGQGKSESVANYKQMWDLELSSLDLMQAACDHLWKTRDAWTSEGGQLAFDNDPDLEKFNGYMKKIEENTARQSTMSQDATEKAMKHFK